MGLEEVLFTNISQFDGSDRARRKAMKKKIFGTRYDIFSNGIIYSVYTGSAEESISVELLSGEIYQIIEILNENQIEISLKSPVAKKIARQFKEEREEVCDFDGHDPLMFFGD